MAFTEFDRAASNIIQQGGSAGITAGLTPCQYRRPRTRRRQRLRA